VFESTLTVKIWDVQHGSAAFMKTPNGTTIAQDLGDGSFQTGSKKFNPFSPFNYLKNEYGIDRLDWAIITHPHRDHIDDILNFDILDPRELSRPKNFDEEAIITAAEEEDKEKFVKYFKIDKKYSKTVSDDEDPRLPENNGGADIQLFFPQIDDFSDRNNRSIVTIVTYAGNKVILPGDNEEKSWRALLADDKFKKAIKGTGIFVAAHHGRESGFCREIFDYFKPKLTIISDGRRKETDAADKYRAVTAGFKVYHSASREYEYRQVLSTRNDKRIDIELGNQFEAGIAVTIA